MVTRDAYMLFYRRRDLDDGLGFLPPASLANLGQKLSPAQKKLLGKSIPKEEAARGGGSGSDQGGDAGNEKCVIS